MVRSLFTVKKVNVQTSDKEETVEAFVGLDGKVRKGFWSKLLCIGTYTTMSRKDYDDDDLQDHS